MIFWSFCLYCFVLWLIIFKKKKMALCPSILTAVIWTVDHLRTTRRKGCTDKEIRNGINAILCSYSDESLCDGEGKILDFRRLELQCGYLYLYVARHSRMVEAYLGEDWTQEPQLVWSSFDGHGPTCTTAASLDQWLGAIRASGRGHLRVCCVGGGPGTDLVGIALLAEKKNWGLPIKGAVLDKWATSWQSVFHHLSARVDPSQTTLKSSDIEFCKFDFFQCSNAAISQVASADLVTIVKFVSAVCSDIRNCQSKLRMMLMSMKPGALLFFIDNSGGGSYGIIREVAELCGLLQVLQVSHTTWCLPPEEMNMDLIDYYKQRFGGSPEKSLKVTISMWMKPGDVGAGGRRRRRGSNRRSASASASARSGRANSRGRRSRSRSNGRNVHNLRPICRSDSTSSLASLTSQVSEDEELLSDQEDTNACCTIL